MYRNIFILLVIFSFNFSNAQQQNSSSDLIENALIKAQKENKHVFINYLSSSCKVSEKMKSLMNTDSFKQVFASNYVVVNITISKEETSDFVHCSNPVKAFGESNCDSVQFPFWYVLDKSGNFVATSFVDGEQNIGYPNKENMDSFLAIIKNTSNFTESNLKLISNSFFNKNNQQLYTSK
ncbi:conserved exported hypothetical protein [Tenacibaculum sp. 190524A05c]|uniref:hypothetical protein n=1 Tax=Tenacibaculum platacis TaxID=3137852 RepID=UPI0031FA7C20